MLVGIAAEHRRNARVIRRRNEIVEGLQVALMGMALAVGMAVAQNLRESGVATVSSSLINDNRKFVPEYQSGIWTGEMYAYSINSAGDVGATPLWKASTVLPSYSSRNFLIWNPDSTATVSFDWSTIGATNQAAMTSGSANLVNFIKGDTTNEGTASDTYRQRSGVLPDFINSTPVYAKGALDMSYENLGNTAASSYRQFVTDKSGRSVPLVMIGSNGGYVSGFNPDTGVESFAFVPRGVLPNLYKLSSQDYGISSGTNEHQYYVDGPLTEADAYYSSGWKNLLIGSLGAGGKGLFALKLPVSSSDGTSPSVLWDLTTTTNANVGNITSEATVGMLPNGDWKVFVGNGYNSTNGTASLLMIDVATGAITAIGTGSTIQRGAVLEAGVDIAIQGAAALLTQIRQRRELFALGQPARDRQDQRHGHVGGVVGQHARGVGDDDVAGLQLRDENASATDRARLFVAGPVINGQTADEGRAMAAKVAASYSRVSAGICWRVSRSISRRLPRSSPSHSEMAMPSAPAIR